MRAVNMNWISVLVFLFFTCAGAETYLEELLTKLEAASAQVLYDDGHFVVLDVTKVYGDTYKGVRTCYVPARFCVDGYLVDSDRHRALIMSRHHELIELDLQSLSTSKVKKYPAYATVGPDKVVEIHHGDKVIKVPKGIPKWWAYPKPLGVIPCGDKYWIDKYGEEVRIYVDPDSGTVKRVKGRAFCINGNLVLEKDVKGKSISLIEKPSDEQVKLLGKVEIREVSPSVRLLGDYVLLWDQNRALILDKELRRLGEVKPEGNIILLAHLEGKLYFTVLTPFERFELISFDTSTGKVEKLFSVKEKNRFRNHKFLPIGDRKFLRISPPFEVCIDPIWQGGCSGWKYYEGLAEIIELPEGRVVRRIAIPKRADVYPLKRSFVYCLRGKCFFVNSSLEVKPLDISGSSDPYSLIVRDILLFQGSGGKFVVFPDGTYRKIPENCYVRKHSKTAFCIKSEREVELRDLRTWRILGKKKGVFYPDHVYLTTALKRVNNNIMILTGGRAVGSIGLSCSDLRIRRLIFNRDIFYVLYSDRRNLCLEGYRLDVDLD